MYNQKLVASVKANNKVLREFKDTVYIPFASEYSILLKNLNTVRAVVNVFIDGENVVPGGLVIDPGRTVDLERWIKNGNLSEGNKFKFIERTSDIENGRRGIKLEDGLIRIEHQFEMPRPIFNNTMLRSIDRSWISASGSAGDVYSNASYSTTNASLNSLNVTAQAQSFNDVGITVPGSKSTQKFAETTMGSMESEKHSMVIKLLGETPDNKPVVKPVTVFTKQKCGTCDKTSKAHSKFCSHCGTSLQIFA